MPQREFFRLDTSIKFNFKLYQITNAASFTESSYYHTEIFNLSANGFIFVNPPNISISTEDFIFGKILVPNVNPIQILAKKVRNIESRNSHEIAVAAKVIEIEQFNQDIIVEFLNKQLLKN